MTSLTEEKDLLALNSLVKEQKLYWMNFRIFLCVLALSVCNILVLSSIPLFVHISLLNYLSERFDFSRGAFPTCYGGTGKTKLL